MTSDTTTQARAGADSHHDRVPLLADTPLDDPARDSFGFAVFANALALVVDHPRTATPLTIAISAPWGGGKSSVGRMMQTLLERRVARRNGDDPRLVCWFNAWEHEDASHLGAALAGSVARDASRHRPWWRRALFPLPSAMQAPGERLRATLLIAAITAAVVGMLVVPSWTAGPFQQLAGGNDLPDGGKEGIVGVATLAMLLFQRLFATAKNAARFIDDPRSEATRGSMSDVKHQLGTLIRHATHDGRLVILIEDLDRCESTRALEVCRVASQLLSHPGVVTILLADMTPIAASAAARYSASGGESEAPSDSDLAEDAGRRYLEKIAQIELELPPPDPTDMRAVASHYSAAVRKPGSGVHVVPGSFLRVAAAARLTALFDAARVRGRSWWPLAARWLERFRWRYVVLGMVLATVVIFAVDPSEPDQESPAWVVKTWATAILLIIAAGSGGNVLRTRKRLRRREYERRIEELKERGHLSEQDVEAEILEEARPKKLHVERDLISDLVSSSFLDSPEFRAVERFVADHPSRLPREGKRIFNHAQLMTQIARGKGMFGGGPPLIPEHLAKWVVLRERWPALGRAISLRPELLEMVEEAAVSDRLDNELDAHGLPVNDTQALANLLRAEPPLGPVIARLVYFTPVPSQAKDPKRQVSNDDPRAVAEELERLKSS